MTKQAIQDICSLRSSGYSVKLIAERYRVHQATIYSAIQNALGKKKKTGICGCSRPGKYWTRSGWACEECFKIEKKLQGDLGACHVEPRAKYSELDFRGRVFGR